MTDNERLTIEEIEEYIILWQTCGEKEALIKLIKGYYALMVNVAKKYLDTLIPFDDLLSICKESFIRAVSKYDYENYSIITFFKYIQISMENGIRMELRKSKKHQNIQSLDINIVNDNDEEFTLKDIIPSNENTERDIEKMLAIEAVNELLLRLTEKERKIIILRYGLNGIKEKTQKEIGKEIGLSQPQICRIERKALIKMRHPRNTRKSKDFLEE